MQRHLKRSRGVICREVVTESGAMTVKDRRTRKGKGVRELRGVGRRCQSGGGSLQLGDRSGEHGEL